VDSEAAPVSAHDNSERKLIQPKTKDVNRLAAIKQVEMIAKQ
jgi:hypothetical protein